jgi:PKD repeat protein
MGERLSAAPKRTLTAALSLLVVSAGLVFLAPAGARADTAPADPTNPATPVSVSADGLPTTQINGVAWSQVVVGNTVYVGGQFTSARPAGAAPGTLETPRSHLLAYDIRTGELIPSFAPSLNGQVLVVVASPDGSRIYIGGDFTTVDGQTRRRVAAFDTASGALLPTFAPSVSGQVRAIAATGTTVYLGGNFTAVGSIARTRLAALSAGDGSLLPWAPVPGVGSTAGNSDGNTATSNEVMALVVTGGGDQVVAAGRFDSMNGVKATGVTALDPVTGATRPFAINTLITNQGINSAVYSLSTTGSTVFGTAYDFYGPGNLEGSFEVTANGGAVLAVNDCRGDSYSSFPMGGALYLSSHAHNCGNIGGYPEQPTRVHKFATAVTIAATGKVGSATLKNSNFVGKPAPSLLSWFPTLTPGTYTGAAQAGWTVNGNNQYIVYGGEFPRVNGVPQQGLVRFAVPSIAPDEVGPAVEGFTAAATSPAPGLARVTWAATSDQDNETLTYRVYRDGNTAAPVYETVLASTWWRKPTTGFTDDGLSAGAHTYRVTATDPFGNVATSEGATVTVASGGATVRPYADAVRADGAQGYWPLGEPSRGIAYDNVGTSDLDVDRGVTVGQTGALVGDPDRAYKFSGKSNSDVSTGTATAAPNTFSVEAWFQTTSRNGGKIVGFGSSANGSSTTYDRHVYMDTSGRVYFGVLSAGARRTVNGPATYNDGTWHHVVASLGSGGMALYLDGSLVASRADTTSGQSYNAYLRVGGDRNWAGADNFTGQIDEVVLYPAVLPADRVANHASIGRTGKPMNLRPTSSFSTSVDDLAVTVDGTGSVDPEGPVAAYAWNFGDGTTGTGVTATHAYAAGGTYTVTLVVTDSVGATGMSAAPVTVTPNRAPTAAFTASADDLAVTVDGAGSADPDGSLAAFAWDFGDGTAGAGSAATHAYATDGTYTVTLTVTDDDGATATAQRAVTVAAPVVLATDSFGRTVSGGLGTADVGGVWTSTSGPSRQSVAQGTATLGLAAPGNLTGSALASVSQTSAEVLTTFSLSAAPTGTGTSVFVTGRRVGTNLEYRARVRFLANGSVGLVFSRLAGSATETLLGSEVIVPGLTYTPGTSLRARVQVWGTGTTQLSARVWAAGATEPVFPQATASDTTASLQTAGGLALSAYLYGSATAPVDIRFTSYAVTPVG